MRIENMYDKVELTRAMGSNKAQQNVFLKVILSFKNMTREKQIQNDLKIKM
jgi:hypothetical protein